MTTIQAKRSRTRRWAGALAAVTVVLAGCGAGSSPGARALSSPPPADGGGAIAGYAQPSYAPSNPRAAPEVAPSPPPPPAATAPSGGADKSWDGRESRRAERDDRPGLATQWGETRTSHIRTTSFSRANEETPSATTALFYNDRDGARAQANAEGFRSFDRAAVALADGGVTISLKDEGGRTLSGFFAGGKTFAIGDAGSRYTIVLTNRTPARFEAVVSVDGLDVIDGHPASFAKRGYLINPHDSVEIEGFRQSESAVAAFRFGSVRGSYAAKKGDDRNVGVIGLAVFHERGFTMWPWDTREVERRRDADPFPNRFATPPRD